jgi:hypothetical protein
MLEAKERPMLMKTQSGEMQTRVAALSATLGVPDVLSTMEKRRRAWLAASEKVAAAKAAHLEAAGENWTRSGEPPHPAVSKALREWKLAVAAQEEARADLERARNDAAARFSAAIAIQIDQATPLLEELVDALARILDPLGEIHLFAIGHNFSAPRLVHAVPVMREAVRLATQCLNEGSRS